MIPVGRRDQPPRRPAESLAESSRVSYGDTVSWSRDLGTADDQASRSRAV